ncbi:MAG: hypothetical protein F9K22_06520 [Bacteroidetes bacterium]|nr:MAG: hypothetical protein F9K22_06520 [Bacteroidota bacterium]
MDAEERQRPYYRRHLPHFHPSAAVYFVTFRLAGSLPGHVLNQVRQERQFLKERIAAGFPNMNREAVRSMHRIHFERIEQSLDSVSTGPRWLERSDCASTVLEAVRFHDVRSYDLIAGTVMPNHVHVMFYHDTREFNTTVTDILGSIKRYSGRLCNTIVNRTGNPFWQEESYDHIVRSDAEFEATIRYIVHNPVKSGLTDDWRMWRWTYVKQEYRSFFSSEHRSFEG